LDGFLAIGRDLVPAAEKLAAGSHVMALSMLAGHATECLLKAILSRARCGGKRLGKATVWPRP
jgi:hypothetical protein